MKDLGNSIVLRRKKSNRDAIGAAVTIEAITKAQTLFARPNVPGGLRISSQHTREVFSESEE
jgi:hypothetical protein